MHLLLIGLRSLFQHRRRSLLLGAALALVSLLLVMMFAFVATAESGIFNMFTTLFTGHVNVEGFYKPTAGRSQPAVTDFPRIVDLLHKEIPEAEDVVARVRGWARVVSPKASVQLATTGTDIARDGRLRRALHPSKGSIDGLAAKDTILLFASVADRLGVEVGDAVTLVAPTLAGAYNSKDVTVVAIAPDIGEISKSFAFVSNTTLRELYGLNDRTTGALLIYLRDVDASPKVAARLRSVLGQAGYTLMQEDPRPFFEKTDKVNSEDWKGQRLDISTYEASLSIIGWFVKVMRGLAIGIVGILLLVIVVGVMNTLWISIWERTREIGALRAIGMGRAGVLMMVSSEAMFLGAIATTIGATLGAALCMLINHAAVVPPPELGSMLMQDHLHLELHAGSTLLAIVAMTAFTTLMSLVPAFRATRLSPIVAMQHTT